METKSQFAGFAASWRERTSGDNSPWMCQKCAKIVKRAKNVPKCEKKRGQDLASPFARNTEATKVQQKTLQLYQYRQTVNCLIISRLDPNWVQPLKVKKGFLMPAAVCQLHLRSRQFTKQAG